MPSQRSTIRPSSSNSIGGDLEPQPVLIGPFSEALTLRGLPLRGALKDEQLEVIEEAGVIVDRGQIIKIGVWGDLREMGLSEYFIDVPMVLTPGLIDAHTHLCYAGSRARDYADRLNGVSYREIATRGGGIKDTMRQTRCASEEELVDLNLVRLTQHLRRGVTTVEIKSGYGLSVSDELKQLRAIRALAERTPQRLVSTCLAAHVPPPEFDAPEEYLQEVLQALLPTVKREGLSDRVDAFIEPSAFSVERARPYLERAQEMGFSLTLHADQFERGGARLAASLGALSADHLEVSTENDLRALSHAGVTAIALPGASLGLGCGFTSARLALDLGCSLAIASDWNPGSAPMGDLLLQASVLGAHERLSAAEVWAAMTSRAAHALRRPNVGALKSGSVADMLAYPTGDYREILYAQGMLRPAHVWCRGTRVID
jgi:imidazolonepropionase